MTLVDERPALKQAHPRRGAREQVIHAGNRLLQAVRDPFFVQALALVVGLRVALGLVGWAGLELYPAAGLNGDWSELIDPLDTPLGALVSPWQRWDALWYQHIAMTGYPAGGNEAAFFPLYPLCVRVVATLLGGAYGLAALVVSTLAFPIGLLLVFRVVAAELGREDGERAAVYLALAPTAFFFLAGFTESLFLALSVGAILAARRRHFGAAACLGGLAALCRFQGVLVAVPIAIEGVIAVRLCRRTSRPAPSMALPAALAPVLCLGLWMLYLDRSVGTRLGPFGPWEHYWQHHFAPPWAVFADSLHTIAQGGHLDEVMNLAVQLLATIALPLMLRLGLPWSYTAYAVIAVISPWFYETGVLTPLTSAARYALVVFPLFAVLAVLGRRRWVNALVLTTFPVVMSFAFFHYTHFNFVG